MKRSMDFLPWIIGGTTKAPPPPPPPGKSHTDISHPDKSHPDKSPPNMPQKPPKNKKVKVLLITLLCSFVKIKILFVMLVIIKL